jgi:hypothetical protein
MIVLGLVACSVGCSYHARDADSYRKATRELLETRSGDIKGCYDGQLKDAPDTAGTVVVRFTVQAETGAIINASFDEVASSAPAALGQCVVAALEGLVLDPPDARDGDATFQWEFSAEQPAGS